MNKLDTPRINKKGFTVVELLIVVAIVGILATITIIGYGAWRHSALVASVKSDLNGVASAMESEITYNDAYPETIPTSFQASDNVTLTGGGSLDGRTYCVDGTSSEDSSITFYIASDTKHKGAQEGTCATRNGGTELSAPTGLAAVSATTSQISFSWNSVAGASAYNIQCATDSAFINNLSDSQVSGVNATISSLTVNTSYYCRVKSSNGSISSAWSSTLSANTAAPLACPDLPSAPGFINATTATTTSIDISWAAVTCSDSYTIDRSTSSTFASGVTSVSPVGSGTSYSATGLSSSTTYYFRVRAVNAIGSGNWSSTVSAVTGVPVPDNFVATTNSTTQITASWNAVASATSYDLDYSTSSTFASGVTTVNTSSTSSAVSGLIPATTYYFRVKAKMSSYTSANSSTANATTQTPNVVMSDLQYCSGAYSGRPAFHLRLSVDEVSYNLTANTSNVNWSLYRIRVSTYSGSYDQTKTWSWSISIDGQGSSGSSNSIVFKTDSAIGATESISSGTKTITHNADGAKTISYSASDGPGSSIFGSASCSGTYVLSDLR